MVHNLARDVQAFTSNVFLVAGERTALVDAGANFDVVGRLRQHVDELDALVLTHTHPDHVGNVEAIREAFGVETWGYDPAHSAVDNAIADGETLTLGDHQFRALYTPGHASDHLCFYSSGAGVLYAGDLIFQNGGYGRTDLPGSDHRRLVESIDRVLSTVDENLHEMHVGHGPSVVERPYDDVELASRSARMG